MLMKKVFILMLIGAFTFCSCIQKEEPEKDPTEDAGSSSGGQIDHEEDTDDIEFDRISRMTISTFYEGADETLVTVYFKYDTDGNPSGMTTCYHEIEDSESRLYERFASSFSVSGRRMTISFDDSYMTWNLYGDDFSGNYNYPFLEQRLYDLSDIVIDSDGNIISIPLTFENAENMENPLIEPRDFKYDSFGHLLSMDYPYDIYYSYSLGWDDKNIVTYSTGAEFDSEPYTFYLEYSNGQYPAPPYLSLMLILKFLDVDMDDYIDPTTLLLGKAPENLPVSISYDSYRVDFEYEYSDVNILKATAHVNDYGSIMSYTFDFYYDGNYEEPDILPSVILQELTDDRTEIESEEMRFTAHKSLHIQNNYSDGTNSQQILEFDMNSEVNIGYEIVNDLLSFALDSLKVVNDPDIDIDLDGAYEDLDEDNAYKIPVRFSYRLTDVNGTSKIIYANSLIRIQWSDFSPYRELYLVDEYQNICQVTYDYPHFQLEDFEFEIVPDYKDLSYNKEDGYLINFEQNFVLYVNGVEILTFNLNSWRL